MKRVEQVYDWLRTITDPEVPVLNILDLGVVRDVSIEKDKEGNITDAVITITPTYSGCPAMDVISMQIKMVLLGAGIHQVNVLKQLSPAWTTDWMSQDAHQKLKTYGIVPPQYQNREKAATRFAEVDLPCPHCDSSLTEMISAFGATACKALYRCLNCKEPFEYFKCH